MDDTKLGAVERRFAELIWANAPLTSGALVELCRKELSWKKSTTYTVLKKLCERGILQNEGGVVTARIKQDAVQRQTSAAVVEPTRSSSSSRRARGGENRKIWPTLAAGAVHEERRRDL